MGNGHVIKEWFSKLNLTAKNMSSCTGSAKNHVKDPLPKQDHKNDVCVKLTINFILAYGSEVVEPHTISQLKRP